MLALKGGDAVGFLIERNGGAGGSPAAPSCNRQPGKGLYPPPAACALETKPVEARRFRP